MHSLIAMLLLVFASTMVLTGLIRHYAISRELLDTPNARSSHSLPMPHGGGAAIVLIYISALLTLWASGWIDSTIIVAVSGAGTLVAAIGFLDDHSDIPRKWRLLVHLVATLWAIYWLRWSELLDFSALSVLYNWLWILMVVTSLIWLLNLFNFMDGIDGIAGSEALFVSLTGGCLVWIAGSTELALLFYILAASVLGFLVWNWPPAKIFMGDVGSGFLGFILGILAYIAISLELVAFWTWLILFGVFVVDASITLLRRMLRGERWYDAHCTHAYQHAARQWGHLKVTLLTNTINYLWLLPMALLAYFYPHWGWFVAILALIPLIILALKYNAGLPQQDNECS